ncbi:MAG: deoxyribonuclease IV, partial [Chloroflexota bacterium]
MLLGAHISVTGGLDKAFDRAERLACPSFQIFTKSNRQWRARKLSADEIERFLQRQEETGIEPVVCHASYLINIAAPDETIWRRSVEALRVELGRCELLKIPYLVLHPGAHMEEGVDAGIERIVKALDLIHKQLPEYRVKIALELMAGQGTVLGYTFEQLARMIASVQQPERLVACFDTCHALAAGYEFRQIHSYQKMIDEFERVLGLDRLKVIHVNDSAYELSSRLDRHAHIGEGCIGLEPFGYFLNDPRLENVPFLLETPKDDGPLDDQRNLD